MKKRYLIEKIILFAVAAILTGVYVSLCFNVNLWTDEAFTVQLLQQKDSFAAIAAHTAADVHPPLYYWILRVFKLVFGENWTIYKIVSIIPVTGVFILSATYVHKRFDFKTALLFTLMTAALPCIPEYVIQIRMYSWSMFFVTAVAFAALDSYETGRIKSYVLLAVSGALSAYTHYFAFVAAIWIYGVMLIAIIVDAKHRNKETFIKWGAMAIGSLVLYAPWLGILLRQMGGVKSDYWTDEISGCTVPGTFEWLFANDYRGLPLMLQVLFAIAIVIMVVRLIRKRDDRTVIAALALMITVLTTVLGFMLNVLIRPMFVYRYIIPAIALMCLAFAIIVAQLCSYQYWIVFVFMLLVFRTDYITTYVDEYQSTDTDATLAMLSENVKENDIIVYNYQIYDFVYKRYFDENQLVFVDDVEWGNVPGDIYFLCTAQNKMITTDQLAQIGWNNEYLGDYGLEQNPFWVFRFTRRQ